VVAAFGSIGITISTAVATALVTTVLSVAVSFAFTALAGGTAIPSAKGAAGPPQVFRQTITDSFIIYGKRRVAGLLVFFHGLQDSGGTYYRYFVIAVAGHRCKGVVSWMLNDEVVTVDGSNKVTSGKYANNAWLWFQRGLASETANATFVADFPTKWSSAHKGNGVAAIYAKFRLTDNVVQAGMPNITAIIEGRDEIIDYRDGSVGYTRNAALIFYDWMQIPREEGGFGAYPDEIPLASWINAQANVCDETVNGAPRYTFDSYLTTGSQPAAVRDSLIVSCAGTYTFSGGKHLMRPGHWLPVTASLSEDDLAGAIQVSPFLPSDVAANQIQGTYIDPNAGYQGAPFTTQAKPSDDIRQLDIDLAHVTSLDLANRVALIMLKRAACEKQVVWPMNIAGLGVRALDNVQLDTSRYSLSNYSFQVAAWSLTADFGVVATLREENAEIYDDPPASSSSAPPTIVQPSTGIRTLAEIQAILRATYPKQLTIDAIDAGGVSATIRLYGPSGTSSAFTLDYGGTLADQTVAAQTITGKAYATAYYPYIDVDPATLLPSTFAATTVYGDSLNSTTNPYRISLGRKVTTPTLGGGTSSGAGLGGGGYSGGGTATEDNSHDRLHLARRSRAVMR
jgi:hypothetical protein